jgi:hypothetical protein
MRILYLHDWRSAPNGVQPNYLRNYGYTVVSPALPDDDLDAAVRIAQTEFDRHQPDVVVGIARGGAVAMNINVGSRPLVLLCPAWKKWGKAATVKQGTLILHSREDEVVSFTDSEELVTKSKLLLDSLIVVGDDHRLADAKSLSALLWAVSHQCRGCSFSLRSMLLGVLLISLVLAFVAPFVRFVSEQRKFLGLVVQVQEEIESLELRRPPDVPPDQWNRAVAWTRNLIGQVYFLPVASDPDSLEQLRDELRQKLNGSVDLGTLQWIWEYCENAPRQGAMWATYFRDVRLLTKEPITDDDIPCLWSLERCVSLELDNTLVTDEGLKHLMERQNLKYLSLRNTRVTDEGVQRLQQALPECKIVR